jgi:hypothetical protein
MTTRLVSSRPSPSRLRACSTCSTISPALRLRFTPNMPEAQNTQPTGQPTWLEMHSVVRAPSGISTHSTVWPSCSATSSFSVPSSARSLAAMLVLRSGRRWASAVRRALLTLRSAS